MGVGSSVKRLDLSKEPRSRLECPVSEPVSLLKQQLKTIGCSENENPVRPWTSHTPEKGFRQREPVTQKGFLSSKYVEDIFMCMAQYCGGGGRRERKGDEIGRGRGRERERLCVCVYCVYNEPGSLRCTMRAIVRS